MGILGNDIKFITSQVGSLERAKTFNDFSIDEEVKGHSRGPVVHLLTRLCYLLSERGALFDLKRCAK